ncbi:MAG: DUF1572 domain-containing protein [Chitinophagaceae bacterium]|nr:MAG: DUF1572 domain-containing protein [Chitinophagaceae bacterium]
MYLQKITTRLLRYNQWANERLNTWLATNDRKVLYTNTGSSFGTIDRTIQHILSAQIYWHVILTEGRINQFDQPIRENAVEQVMADLNNSSKRLADELSALSEDQLLEVVRASDSTQSRYEYILHLVNHSSYHRGQIITMCRALNINDQIPVTDYDAYLWWIENM